jgi:hypothetical protein
MKFYINGPKDQGDGVYDLLSEDGEVVAGHYCSNIHFARGDLTNRFTDRSEKLQAMFGPWSEHQIAWLGDVPQEERDELLRKNHALGEIWDAFHPCNGNCDDRIADGACPRHGDHPDPCERCASMKGLVDA